VVLTTDSDWNADFRAVFGVGFSKLLTVVCLGIKK
jgi:hypothetical protein